MRPGARGRRPGRHRPQRLTAVHRRRRSPGQSEIRRWLLENDLVDAIVALPTNMFYNTGIATYVWILDNAKPAERDRQGPAHRRHRRSSPRCARTSAPRTARSPTPTATTIVELYDDYAETEHSKIFATDDFGYWTITVERPLRLQLHLHARAHRADPLRTKKLGKGDRPPAGSRDRASPSSDEQVYREPRRRS